VLTAQAWCRLSAGAGAHGLREYWRGQSGRPGTGLVKTLVGGTGQLAQGQHHHR